MAKLVLNDVNSLANQASAKATINDNSTKIEDAIENTLSRDGTGPNAMEADLDVGGHKLLNVADPTADADGVNKRSVKGLVDEFAAQIVQTFVEGTYRVDRFTATAGQQDFTLTDSPGTTANLYVFNNGIMLTPDTDYTLTGADMKTLHFFDGRTLGQEIIARYVKLAPGDSQLRADLLRDSAGYGSDLVKVVDSVAPAYAKTLSDIIKGQEVSIFRFIDKTKHGAILDGTSTADLTTEFQDAFDAVVSGVGINLLIPGGVYNINSQIVTAGDGTHLRGVGRPRLKIGAGQAAGYQMFLVTHNRFTAQGLRLDSMARTHCFYIQPQTAVALTGFKFLDNEFNDVFYSVRADGAVDRLIFDVLVAHNKSRGVVGQNGGHFLVDYGVGVQYIGNTVKYGRNTSAYGAADSKNIVIVGNLESDVEDSGALVEAAAQIEDSDDANAIISGNSFKHDIWISGSNNVVVTGNNARRMRLSVGNADGYNVNRVLVSGNKFATVHAAVFGGAVPERISARIIGNEFDPASHTLSGNPINQLVYGEGTYITELEMKNNAAVSDANSWALLLSRAATAKYRFEDNDFGTKSHSITGSGGTIYARGNRNKPFTGYVDVHLASTFAIAAGAWTAMVYDTETVDANAEYSTATGQFTPGESGTYQIVGHHTIDPDAADSEMGVRLYNVTDGVEVRRMSYLRAQNASQHGQQFDSGRVNLVAGKSYRVEYFLTGATTQFVTGSTLTWMQIVRHD